MPTRIDCCKYCHMPIKVMDNPVFSKCFNRRFCNKECLKEYKILWKSQKEKVNEN